MNLITHNRHQKVKQLFEHPHYNKLMRKLTGDEMLLIANFINGNQNKERNEFVHATNRMFIDQNYKPKNWAVIMEVLTVVG